MLTRAKGVCYGGILVVLDRISKNEPDVLERAKGVCYDGILVGRWSSKWGKEDGGWEGVGEGRWGVGESGREGEGEGRGREDLYTPSTSRSPAPDAATSIV